MSRDESVHTGPEACNPGRFIKDGGIDLNVLSLCQVMEGGTFGALLPRHPLHGRTMSLISVAPLPLVAFAPENTLQSGCFSLPSLVQSPH